MPRQRWRRDKVSDNVAWKVFPHTSEDSDKWVRRNGELVISLGITEKKRQKEINGVKEENRK